MGRMTFKPSSRNQVVADEPVAPRRLNPSVPADLETTPPRTTAVKPPVLRESIMSTVWMRSLLSQSVFYASQFFANTSAVFWHVSKPRPPSRTAMNDVK